MTENSGFLICKPHSGKFNYTFKQMEFAVVVSWSCNLIQVNERSVHVCIISTDKASLNNLKSNLYVSEAGEIICLQIMSLITKTPPNYVLLNLCCHG
jgi:hypothetical protein